MAFTAFNAPPPRAAPTVVKSEPAVSSSRKRIPELESAFSDRQDLLERLRPLGASDEPLVVDLSNYILSLKQAAATATTAATTATAATSQQPPTALPTNKKRKLDEVVANGSAGWADRSARASYTAGDVSFSVPQRKKLRLEWIDAPQGGIRAASAGGDLEFGVSWQDIDQIFALPVPEKAKRQHNFVVIPKDGHGLVPLTPGGPEPIVWTAFEPGPKDVDAPPEPAHTTALLNAQLASFGKAVILPTAEEFESALPQPGRKGEPAYHVKAHRGSKDGFLFFLSHGILFAFKKPLLFLPFSAITSVSYTSVLQRTFNLNVATSVPMPDGETKDEEIEFAMLDQADYAGIDEYIKRHGLHDASLAAGRRAKVYDVNKPRAAKDGTAAAETVTNGHIAAAGDEEDDEMTELQKAEQLLQDEEDEMEEDYVDESGDESGSSDEDEEEYDEEGGGGGGGGDEDPGEDEDEEEEEEE